MSRNGPSESTNEASLTVASGHGNTAIIVAELLIKVRLGSQTQTFKLAGMIPLVLGSSPGCPSF